MTRTLVAYGSKHGSTKEVATAIAADLRAAGHDVDLLSAGAAAVAGPDGYDSVVVGGSLYMGRWHADACRFVRRHHDALSRAAARGLRTRPAHARGERRRRARGSSSTRRSSA